MSIWQTRMRSEAALSAELHGYREYVEGVFSRLDDVIGRFERRQSENTFFRVCGMTMVKARNYGLGLYSLSLDGLGQEAGALLRPLVEAYEVLVYFRLDPTRVSRATDGTLPPAGEIAKKISGRFQDLRSYLNEHASHFAFSPESMTHLIDFSTLEWKVAQPYLEHPLKTNLGVLFGMLIIVLIEGVNCLSVGGAVSIDDLTTDIETFRDEGISFLRNP
ncbi:MAG: hypothetical protein JSV37_10265 [Anaerolineaceae bacterium]|nr:MAG: hypothetical protein JSV37_10265 [Anaerolineaceae bacterium]